MKRYAAKRDQTEPEILRALARVGADYVCLDVIDLLVLFRGQLFLLECKTPSPGRKAGERTRSQNRLVERGWPVHFVTTAERALAVLLGTHP